VKADDTGYRCPTSRQFQSHGPTIAIANRCNLVRVYLGTALQGGEPSPGTGAGVGRLGPERSDQLQRLIEGVHGPALAMEIASQGEISEARQSLGSSFGMIAKSERFWKYKDSCPSAIRLCVIIEMADHRQTVSLVSQSFGAHASSPLAVSPASTTSKPRFKSFNTQFKLRLTMGRLFLTP
jgi:hypothetical protein